MRRLAVLAVSLATAAWSGVAAQNAASQAPQATFRSGVISAQLDVVVTDKNDRPIKNLTKDDFEVTEHGHVQTLTDVQFISIPSVHRIVADTKTAAPTIDVVSNQHAIQGRQWVLVIDDLHIIPTHIVQTKKVVQEFLTSLPAEDSVATVFVGRSDLSQDFTSDLGAQLRAVERIKASLGFAYDAADFGGGKSDSDRHNYGTATTQVLKNIATSLAKSTFPRKTIVYISEGMTYDHPPPIGDFLAMDVWEELMRTFEFARHAGVPIYTLDPRGQPDCTFVMRDCSLPPMHNIRNQFQQMQELAENTGGRAFVNYSNPVLAVHELIEDNDSFYLLAYNPDPAERDGKFHDAKVKIKGRPDLRVRSRAGYTAPKAVAVTEADLKLTLNDVLGAALPVAGLGLRAVAAPITPGQKGGMKTVVTLDVTYPPLPIQKFDDTLAFGVVAIDLDGKVKAEMRGTYQYSATPKDNQDVSFMINASIDLPPQPLVLRVGVASQALDKAASIHVPVEPINPSRNQPQFGAIVIALAGQARETAVPAGALKGLLPIQPTTVRTFATSDTLQVYAPLYWRSTESMTAVAMAIVTVSFHSGDKEISPKRIDVEGHVYSGSRTQQEGIVTGTLKLTGLAPGDYTLDLVARLPTGETVRRSVAFKIKM